MSNLKLLSALFKVQEEMLPVVKGKKNPFFKSNYADLNALREELMPLFEKNGLYLTQPPVNIDGRNFINTIIFHVETGESMQSMNEVIASKQNDPQSFLAAQTYTRRGALQAMFNMSAIDDDGNYASGRASKLETQDVPVKPQRVEQKATATSAPQATAIKPEVKPEEKAKPKFVREQPKQDTKPAQADTTQW
jgi:hypothetical protein